MTNTTVGELSEGKLLERIFPRLDPGTPLVGPGDDAAVISAPDARTVISIDTLVQDQDFRLTWASGYGSTGFDVGWKSAAQNLSDINAMGAVPTSLVVSLTLPAETLVSWVEDLADGLNAAIRQLGASRCSVVGGDLGRGKAIVVTAAVTGDLQGRDPVRRSGAKTGDVVAVGGVLGQAAAGLALLEDSRSEAALPDSLRSLVHRQSRPRPPLILGPAASASGATAMMDISDGLVRDGRRLAEASGVSIDYEDAALRGFANELSEASAHLGVNAMEWVLGGGEDHGLLACFPDGTELPEGFVGVGRVLNGGGVSVDGIQPGTSGWDHFER
ncbi:thiamine-phosphate kinase [Arthrobacter roseus]|uniref:thiamine-phosphate kinase n=1 Tax=Arthrobacter roseus TaxID=136274 RepID=UPI001966948F|nr:thiamine-phosphate kinase [Arthrobacter roseus]MBM7848908.1 thiamine-monophosphate kinase [Arthrobacter roseus]